MHVLHVYKDYAPVVGGIENHIRAVAEGLVRRGHDATVLVTSPGRRTSHRELAGVHVVAAARLATISSTPLSPSLVAELRRLGPDVTHLHCPYPVAEAAWLAVGRRPLVVSYHSDVVRQRLLGAVWAPGLRRVLARADAIVAGSPTYAATSPFLRPLGQKVVVVPYGVDPRRFEDLDRAAARERYGQGPNLVFVGRLRYYKGLDVLIDALVGLPDVKLLVAGVGPKGRDWYNRAVARGVSDRVVWLGHVPDEELPQVLGAGDLYVLPATARSEAFGIAMLEGMAAGLPTVTTELGTGTSWLVQDQKTGLVVPPGDPEALAGALGELLADDERRRAMGAAARARVVADFTVEEMVSRLEDVYREVVA